MNLSVKLFTGVFLYIFRTPRKLATESRKSPKQRRSKSAKVRRKSKGAEKGAKRKAESKSPSRVAKEPSESKARKKRKRIPITTVSVESSTNR